jgi:transcriptional regulator with GAF, ATPase, and Fis domain
MEEILMGERNAHRPGLVEALQRNETTNRKAARALGFTIRQIERLKRRVATQGAAGAR